MISLFVQIYDDKELCPLLFKKFKETNKSDKDNEKSIDRDKDLKKYLKQINDISADSLIKNNFGFCYVI